MFTCTKFEKILHSVKNKVSHFLFSQHIGLYFYEWELNTSHLQRRVQELLGEKIPEDEAKLLSNGKFACTVCNYHPVFDTVDTLLVHRQGKKHAIGATIFADKQKELRDLIEARKVEQFEKYGNTNIKIAPEHLKNRHLMISTPYDARTKKVKPYDRKLKVNILPKSAHSTCSTESSRTQDLPGSSKPKWGHLLCKEPFLHDAQLKNIFHKIEDTVVDIKPYESLRHLNRDVEISRHSIVKNTQQTHISPCNRNSNVIAGECRTVDINIGKEVTNELACQPPPPPPSSNTSTKIITEEEKQYAAKLQQLRGAGWKRDWDGKWIKDEDAEFDTDEEAPDL